MPNSVTRGRPSRGDAGFTLIDMMFVLGLIGMLSTLALPALLRAKNAAHAASAIGTVRLIGGAQMSYALTCGLGFFAPDLPTLGVPPAGYSDTFLPPELTAGAAISHNGYTFSLFATPLAGTPPTCNGLANGLTSPTYAGTMPETGAPPSGAPLDR